MEGKKIWVQIDKNRKRAYNDISSAEEKNAAACRYILSCAINERTAMREGGGGARERGFGVDG